MSIPRESQSFKPDPTVVHYNCCLGDVSRDLTLLARRAIEYPSFSKRLLYLNFFVCQLRRGLPQNGAAIGPRWWQRYAQFYEMIDALQHSEFDDDLEALWISLPESN